MNRRRVESSTGHGRPRDTLTPNRLPKDFGGHGLLRRASTVVIGRPLGRLLRLPMSRAARGEDERRERLRRFAQEEGDGTQTQQRGTAGHTYLPDVVIDRGHGAGGEEDRQENGNVGPVFGAVVAPEKELRNAARSKRCAPEALGSEARARHAWAWHADGTGGTGRVPFRNCSVPSRCCRAPRRRTPAPRPRGPGRTSGGFP